MDSDSDYDESSSGTDYSDSESSLDSEFEICSRRGSVLSLLPYDASSIEHVILKLCDRFDFRVILQDGKMKNALLVTSGLTLAGSLIGKHYGGKVGAAVGGAVGGICGIGVVAVSMRDIWQDVKDKLAEVYIIVYDYLAGLGVDDYKMAAKFLMANTADSTQLAMIIMKRTSEILGKKVLSNLTAA